LETNPLARWGAYALSVDTAKAKASYQDFLLLWNNADYRHPHPQGG
jgi:hypothetical protein